MQRLHDQCTAVRWTWAKLARGFKPCKLPLVVNKTLTFRKRCVVPGLPSVRQRVLRCIGHRKVQIKAYHCFGLPPAPLNMVTLARCWTIQMDQTSGLHQQFSADISETNFHYIRVKLSFNYHLWNADMISHPILHCKISNIKAFGKQVLPTICAWLGEQITHLFREVCIMAASRRRK